MYPDIHTDYQRDNRQGEVYIYVTLVSAPAPGLSFPCKETGFWQFPNSNMTISYCSKWAGITNHMAYFQVKSYVCNIRIYKRYPIR